MVRCYDGPFIRSLDLKSMGPEINTEILYKAQIMRARVVEIPAHLDWTDQEERMRSRKVSIRVSTTSKLLMFSSFLFRPIVFFLVPGILVLIVALWTLGGLAWTVVQQFRALTSGSLDYRITQAFQTAYELRPHSFVVGGFALVIGVQLISLGLLATQTKRYFEETFHLGTGVLRRVERLERQGVPIAMPLLADPDNIVDVVQVVAPVVALEPPLVAEPVTPLPANGAPPVVAGQSTASR